MRDSQRQISVNVNNAIYRLLGEVESGRSLSHQARSRQQRLYNTSSLSYKVLLEDICPMGYTLVAIKDQLATESVITIS